MKTKKAKLTLKKATIANLNAFELANVYGGDVTDITCYCTAEYTNCKQCQIETNPGEQTVDWCGMSMVGGCE